MNKKINKGVCLIYGPSSYNVSIHIYFHIKLMKIVVVFLILYIIDLTDLPPPLFHFVTKLLYISLCLSVSYSVTHCDFL